MATTESSRLVKDFHYLLRHMETISNGQARVSKYDENRLKYILLDITPNDGHYKNATLRFLLRFVEPYPQNPPRVQCLDRVYHPNIDSEFNPDFPYESNICVSIFLDWTASMDLDHVVMGILYVLHQPNLEDALSVYFDGTETEADFATNVQATLAGETLEGITFPKLLRPASSDHDNRDAVDEDNKDLSVANGNKYSASVTVANNDKDSDIVNSTNESNVSNNDKNPTVVSGNKESGFAVGDKESSVDIVELPSVPALTGNTDSGVANIDKESSVDGDIFPLVPVAIIEKESSVDGDSVHANQDVGDDEGISALTEEISRISMCQQGQDKVKGSDPVTVKAPPKVIQARGPLTKASLKDQVESQESDPVDTVNP